MKSITRIVTLVIVAVLLINLAGCYGSFSLTKKLYEWNGSLGDKLVDSAVMWVLMIIPAYSAAGFIDLVVLNTVEFWTGQNPLAMNKGEQVIRYATNDGKTYKITTTQNNINITETAGPDKGKSIELTYTPQTGSWFLNDGVKSTNIASITGSRISLLYPDNTSKEVILSR